MIKWERNKVLRLVQIDVIILLSWLHEYSFNVFTQTQWRAMSIEFIIHIYYLERYECERITYYNTASNVWLIFPDDLCYIFIKKKNKLRLRWTIAFEYDRFIKSENLNY